MKFRNKINKEEVEIDVTNSVLLYAYTHNSNWEEVESEEKLNSKSDDFEKLTKVQLAEKLAERGITADEKCKKDDLIKLLNQAIENAGANLEAGKAEEE